MGLEQDDNSIEDEDEDDDDDDVVDHEDVSIAASNAVVKHDTPQEQESTRFGRKVKLANYDMKHHPMDTTLKPRATKKCATARNLDFDLNRSTKIRKSSGTGEAAEESHENSSLLFSVGISPLPEPGKHASAKPVPDETEHVTAKMDAQEISLGEIAEDMEGAGRHYPRFRLRTL